jgi:prepilin signal peptidase PulO-like enzyme (type II secretory pathway)
MFDIIAAMGRMRIKKKGDAKPFRETMAYRLLLVLISILLFLYTLYEMVAALTVNNTTAFIIALVAGVLCAISLFYNLERARHIPMPERKRHR